MTRARDLADGADKDIAGTLTLDDIVLSNDMSVADNGKVQFGAGNDLQIFHNASASYITDQGTGNLVLGGDAAILLQNSAHSANMLDAYNGGRVGLYHSGTLKAATTASGIDVTGTAVTDGLTVAGNVSVDGGTIKLDGNYPTGTANVALGDTALDSVASDGNNNTAVGHQALTANTTADNNAAFGSFTLATNTTGASNTAAGHGALYANTTGASNTSVGTNSLVANTTGTGNVAVGKGALDAVVSADNNTAVGTNALSATTNSDNTAVGSDAGEAVTSGYNNTFVGKDCAKSTTTGNQNTSMGWSSMKDNTTGDKNSAFGQSALQENTTSSNNSAFGYRALYQNTTGASTVAVGNNAGYSQTTNGQNVFVGQSAGYYTDGYKNCYVGFGAGDAMTTGDNNTIIGSFSGNENGLDIRTSNNYIVLSDGDGNPRGIFDNNGQFMVNFGQTSDIDGNIGASSGSTTFGVQKTDGIRIGQPGSSYWNKFSDGVIVNFRSAGTTEGNIQVSGTTVSYVGGNLARWSQLADNTRDTSIVKGTVMTNLDQMAEWTKDGVTEDNEQLNCMAVSSVEGDANVAGVFVSWDDDDTDYDNDMTVAMTGDMVIRIAQGTTVSRGDLLMSAGDGTAKPQGDDIVRSKTIAKVTSTHISHTYDDGSYLVPCVLMAC